MAGLLAYPILIDPLLGLRAQQGAWTVGFLVYLGLMAYLSLRSRLASSTAAARDDGSERGAGELRPVYWLMLSAAPAALLLASTNLLTQELGSAPMIWVLPLAVYLFSFIAVFRDRPWIPAVVRRFWPEVSLVGVYLFFDQSPRVMDLAAAYQLPLLLVVCLVAHGELHRTRPAPHRLTLFYLFVTLGGWMGAAFVTLAAPALFERFFEHPLALLALALTLALGRRRELPGLLRGRQRILILGSVVLSVLVGVRIASLEKMAQDATVAQHRNPYGVYTVREAGSPDQLVLMHGNTIHGRQQMTEAGRSQALGYYHRDSPLGDVMSRFPAPRRVGAVGLGIGALSTYLEAGESLVVYELDPDVATLARQHFHHLTDARAEVRLVFGDARVMLQEAAPAAYDLLILDAFIGDAIPTHLMTLEALDLYLDKLAPEGLLLVHISSRFYDFRGVLAANAHARGLAAMFKQRQAPRGSLEDSSDWFAMARNGEVLNPLAEEGWLWADERSGLASVRPWTDDRSDLLRPFLAYLRGHR
ncbi:MAG: fused MFS/spermidine synthase [Deltaproteobacteria bacterium]|nr:fused MFS/spermidine synthase [Deltaproteobacteria bacterium]MBW2534359.1 fused MFS/spermidine synthase [Deltaproteobacteria bacterium]